MDIVMETGQRASLVGSEKLQSSPKPVFCEDAGENILLDTFFDHSRPLDSNALDALLNTKFNTDFEEIDDEPSTSDIAASWRPAQSGIMPQQQSSSKTAMEPSTSHEKQPALQPAHSDAPFNSPSQVTYGSSLCATSNHSDHSYPSHMNPSSPYNQQSMAHLQQAASLGQMPNHMGQGHYYPTSAPVAMPTMNDVYHDLPTHPQQNGYYSPSNVSRQGTADLMDYENIIPEENEAGDAINGDVVDPCYAQLLYRCLLEAPEHTMALKDVYKWVRQYSQKARDSAGTGWQNSVRHNLSMNAAFERVTASGLHGPKKGSLWRLTNRALREGVISTTRYRKDPKRKPERRSSPALKRQISGAKGGQATRAASAHRRAMQARGLSTQNLNSLERHRHNVLKQEPVFLTPTSSPASNRATASPHPSWMPHGLPGYQPHYNSVPASPYFMQSVENDPYAMGPPQSISDPHTPPQMHVGFAAPLKHSPPTLYGSPSGSYVNEFEMAYHEPVMGLFANHDEFTPNTPSLGTEMSFTDDTTPMSRQFVSVEPMRS